MNSHKHYYENSRVENPPRSCQEIKHQKALILIIALMAAIVDLLRPGLILPIEPK
jgi:hypothetical protein